MDKPETHFKLTLNSQSDNAKQENQAEDVFFTKQYRETVTPIFRYLFSRVQNIHDAEDLTSQTFITAYENLSKLKNPKIFTAWVFTIARNKTYDFFRRSQRHPNVQFDEKMDQESADRRINLSKI
jgi:RNA polymerase sigma-70 factor (ECF subfamily)